MGFVFQPVEKKMSSWMEYICDVIHDGGLLKLCIVQMDRNRWIASSPDFLMSHDEITYFNSLYEESFVNIQVRMKGRWYRLIANDGVTLQSEDDEQSEVLVVARTDNYLIFGTRDLKSEQSRDVCRIEIDWIRNCIKEQED